MINGAAEQGRAQTETRAARQPLRREWVLIIKIYEIPPPGVNDCLWPVPKKCLEILSPP